MLLQYGPVNLNQCFVEEYERTPVFQGPNYLYTRHKITVTAVFNPATQQELLAGDPAPRYNQPVGGSLVDVNGNLLPFVPLVPNNLPAPVGPLLPAPAGLPPLGSFPTPNAGRPAAYTAKAVQHALAQPRQRLVISVGGVILLQSPLPGLDVDCSNGPTPVGEPVVKLMGTRTFRVRFTVQTDVNEAPLRGSGGTGTNFLHAVLSHRWSMQHDLDHDFFAKRVISGRLVFRADVLHSLGLVADDFRRYFFHPIPIGFARREVHVKALDDEVTVDYQVVDQQLAVGWAEAGVTRIEAAHTVRITKHGLESTAVEGVTGFLKQLGDIISRAKLEEATLNSILGGITSGIGGTLATAYKMLPILAHNVRVHVWGSPSSNRTALRTFALNIASQRVGAFGRGINALVGGNDFRATDNIVGKEVEVDISFISPPFKNVADALKRVLAGQPVTLNSYFPADDNTGLLLFVGASSATSPSDDAVGRDASYLEVCVAGALTGDAATGAQAAFQPTVRDRAAGAVVPTTDF